MELFKLVGSIFIESDEANNEIDKTAKKASDMATKLGESMQKAGGAVTSLGKKIAPVSAVVGGALLASTKAASDFQDSMAKMSTLYDTTIVDTKKLSNEFLSLSGKTGLAATELAEAGYQALSAGIDVKKSVKFVESASNLARSGFTSTSTAVDVLTTAINAYGFTADDATDISNKLVRTQNLGKTTVDELASSMGKVIPTASSMNVNIDNLTAGYVQLTKQGIATAESTTYMSGMLNELGKSTTTVGKVLKESTGKSFQNLMKDGSSLGDILQILQDYSKKTGTNFNELWGSAEAGKAGVAILNAGVKEFNSTVKIMASKTDDVGDALNKLDTPSVKLKRSLNQLKNTGIQLGNSFLNALAPTIEAVTDGISTLAGWFESLPEGMKTTIATVMAVIAVLGPILIIVGKIISAIGSIVTALGFLKGAVLGIMGVLKSLWVVMAANPIGLIITVITALVTTFVHLWNHSEAFRNFWKGLWVSIKKIVSRAVSSIKGIVIAIFTAIKGFIRGTLNAIKGIFSAVWGGIKGVVSSAVGGVKSIITGGLNAAKRTVSSVLNGIKNTFTSVFNGIKRFLSPIVNWLKGIFNFKWSLPKIKLPHFKISGKFSLMPPSTPKFGIEWYKKAMDSPMMFKKPTLFGLKGSGDLMGAGEAGDEVMMGKDTMLGLIRAAVSSEIVAVSDAVERGIQKVADSISAKAQTGDTVIPVYIGSELIDEIVVNAKKRITVRSGGIANV